MSPFVCVPGESCERWICYYLTHIGLALGTHTHAHTLGYCFRKCHRKSESLSLDSHLWRQHIIGRTTLCFMRLAEHDKPSTRVGSGSQQFVSRLRSSAAFCGHQYTCTCLCVCVCLRVCLMIFLAFQLNRANWIQIMWECIAFVVVSVLFFHSNLLLNTLLKIHVYYYCSSQTFT